MRLKSTWRRRTGSPRTADGTSGPTLALSARPFAADCTPIVATVSATVERRSISIASSSMWPASIFGHIKNVIDEREQRLAARTDVLDIFALRGAQARIGKELRHANHAVHRRADLVAHVGEEFAFGAIRAGGGVGRLDERELGALLFRDQLNRSGHASPRTVARGFCDTPDTHPLVLAVLASQARFDVVRQAILQMALGRVGDILRIARVQVAFEFRGGGGQGIEVGVTEQIPIARRDPHVARVGLPLPEGVGGAADGALEARLEFEHRGFRGLAFGDVDDRTGDARRVSRHGVRRNAALTQPAHRTVRPDDAELPLVRCAVGARRAQRMLVLLAIVRVHQFQPERAIGQCLARAEAQDLAHVVRLHRVAGKEVDIESRDAAGLLCDGE